MIIVNVILVKKDTSYLIINASNVIIIVNLVLELQLIVLVVLMDLI